MTVAELIRALETYPQHLPVVAEGRLDHNGLANIGEMSVGIHPESGEEEVHLVLVKA